jgi:sulfate adenylyltransferase subunit 1
LILIDARKGILEQTKRHSFIASLLQIKHIIVCVNKMDLVDYAEETFEEIKAAYIDFASKLDVEDIRFIPISALKGDNVVDKGDKMDWYSGGSLLNTLEEIYISSDRNLIDCRFPVQNVIRPQSDEYHDFRGYAGRVESGVFKVGDEVMSLPSGFTSKIKTINCGKTDVAEAFPPMSVCITLEDDIDTSRGDMIVRVKNQPKATQDLDVMLCWLGDNNLVVGKKYIIRHTSNEARTIIKEIQYKVDINTLHRLKEDKNIAMNDVSRVTLRTTKPLLVDSYKNNKSTGSFIIVDEGDFNTVAAGMII